MRYDFSENEVNALLVLIDQAVRATGIEHAGNASYLVAKLKAPWEAQATSAPAANDAVDAGAVSDAA